METHEDAAVKRSPEQQRADYEASHAAKQRLLADPGLVEMLRAKLRDLSTRTGR